MAEPRARSLLEFAIAASVAVVPVMLAMVLLVAVVRPASEGPAAPERHRSHGHVAALQTFEAAVVPRASSEHAAVAATDVLDGVPACRRDWSTRWRAADWLAAIGWPRVRAGASPADRIAGQLTSLDASLAAFSDKANARVGQRVGLDAGRWFAAARMALEPAAPGDPTASAADDRALPRVACADLVTALSLLARNDGALLGSLAWRGTEANATLARWQPGQQMAIPAGLTERSNPWRGVAGCIYLGAGDGDAPTHFVAGPRSVQRRVCGEPALYAAGATAGAASAPQPVALAGEPRLADPADDARWSVPPSLATMLLPLDALRRPSGATALRVPLDGVAVEVGDSVRLTIDPALQALAQKTAACYTGRHDVCRALGLTRADAMEPPRSLRSLSPGGARPASGAAQRPADRPIGAPMLEGAMVRMAAIAVVDVASGRIEALAGALSPCARQEVDGPGRDASCDRRLPYPVQYRPDGVLNPAVFHDAMPASTIKPIMAAAFLADGDAGRRLLASEQSKASPDAAPPRESLRGQLLRSDSVRFLDRMFCLESDVTRCRRAWDVQAAAAAFGWNTGCADGGADCGRHDLLFGTALPAASTATATTSVSYGRLMTLPLRGADGTLSMHERAYAALDPGIVRRCAEGADGRRASKDDWEKCKGGSVVDVVAEGWGQGHARASALGVAGMMQSLAAAANGATDVTRPHLVRSLHGAGVTLADWRGATQPSRVPADAAATILGGLSWSHRIGTARSACAQVFGAKACPEIHWLAGKTGTPSFPSDGISLDALAAQCPPAGAARTANAVRGPCSSLRPYKWYVAAWRADGAASGPWTKAIAVLTERNWIRASGMVHGAGDHGPNPSAEIAMQIAGRQLGLLPAAAP